MNNSVVFCRTPISPVRKDNRDSSEMVTQMLFGELAEVLQTEEKWLQIRSLEDDYEGFVDPKQYLFLSPAETEIWKKQRNRSFCAQTCTGKTGKMMLPAGCFVANLPFETSSGSFQFSINHQPKLTWQEFATTFLNTSYLWGGRTAAGIDCSGFSQQILRFRGCELPRDASQQAKSGEEIAFGQHQAGDVAFFKNDNEKIIHVGILLDEKTIIHASGFVRIDTFDEHGIFNVETKKYSHQLAYIKRY